MHGARVAPPAGFALFGGADEALGLVGVVLASLLLAFPALAAEPPLHPGVTYVIEVDGRDAAALAASFDLGRFGRAPARFDEAELHRLNAAVVHHLPFTRVAHLLPQGMSAAGWEAVRPNLAHIGEAAEWWQVVTGPITPPEFGAEDQAFLAVAAAALEQAGCDWTALTAALKETTGRKGKPLFLPLRQALTGHDHGPEMAALLPLIGRDAALERLRAAASG